MKSLKFGQAIEVTWVDATSYSGWSAPYKDGVEVVNVGLFVQQNKNGLCLAKGVVKDDPEDVLAPSFIPRACIRKIRRLR